MRGGAPVHRLVFCMYLFLFVYLFTLRDCYAAKCNTNAKCNNIDAKCNKVFNAKCNNFLTQNVITFLM